VKEKREKRPAPRPPSEVDSDRKSVNGELSIPSSPVPYPVSTKESRSSSSSSAGVEANSRSTSCSPSVDKRQTYAAGPGDTAKEKLRHSGVPKEENQSHAGEKTLDMGASPTENGIIAHFPGERRNGDKKEGTARPKSDGACNIPENLKLPTSASSAVELSDTKVADTPESKQSTNRTGKSKRTSKNESITVVPISTDKTPQRETVSGVSVNSDDMTISRTDSSTPTIVRVNANSPFELLEDRHFLRQDSVTFPNADQVHKKTYNIFLGWGNTVDYEYDYLISGRDCCK